MKIITKKNFLIVLCCTYTILSLSSSLIDILVLGKINPTQTNLLLCLILSAIAVFILSQHYRFDRYSLITVIIMQYVVAMFLVFLLVWLSGFFVEIHPDGYHDVFVSFTIPYWIGAIFYYINLFVEVKKQNEMIQEIKKTKYNI